MTLGSDLTVEGNLTIDGCDFGAAEDGATSTAMAALRVNGTLAPTATGRLQIGEGRHYFGGNLDLSAGDNRVIALSPGNNTEPEVHFTGGTQSLDFSAGGSYFRLDSVAGTTSVTHSGLCILVGNLDLSGSTQADAWTSTPGSNINIGDGTFGVTGSATLGNADANFQLVLLQHVFTGTDTAAHTEYEFARDVGATGVYRLADYLIVQGDAFQNSSAVGLDDENNAAVLTLKNCELVLDPAVPGPLAVVVQDGVSDSIVPAAGPLPAPVEWQGNGAELTLENATLRAPLLQVGVATIGGIGTASPPVTEHMGARFRAENASLDFNLTGTGNGLTGGHFAALELLNTGISGEGVYTLETIDQTHRLTMLGCDISRGLTGAAPYVAIRVGAQNLSVIQNDISGLDSAGFEIRALATVLAFNGNTFTGNTQQGGTAAHITLQGVGAGSALYWDGNHFDDSVGTGTGGLFVNVLGGSNPVQFRVPAGEPDGFGVSGFAVTAAQAETFDNDGNSVGVEVTWDDAADELAAIDESAALPAGLITSSAIAHQTVLLFGLNALSGTHTVDGLSVTLEAAGNVLDDAAISTATLFDDVNGNGAYDSGEEFAAGTLDQSVSGGQVTFDLAGAGAAQTIASGNTVHWGVSIRFGVAADGMDGAVQCFLLPGELVLNNPGSGVVSGLPIQSNLPVSGPPTALRMVTQPGGVQLNLPLNPQPVVEVIDGNGTRVLGDSSTVVNADIGLAPIGGVVLGGTTSVTVVEGLAAFTNLSIPYAGPIYTLDFDATGLTGTTTAAFEITAAPPVDSGGDDGDDDDGGCSTGGDDGRPWLMLAALGALGLMLARRFRRA